MANNEDLTIDNFDPSKFEAKLQKDEPAEIHRLHNHIRTIGRAIVYEDGDGDYCIRLRSKTTNTHVNPAADRYGHTQCLTNGHVAFAEFHQCLRSKFDDRHLVHQCGDPKKIKGKSESLCVNGAHILLRSRTYNNETEKCFNHIRKFVNKHRCIKAIPTNGKITVAIANSLWRRPHKKHRCHHTKNPCFVIIRPSQ